VLKNTRNKLKVFLNEKDRESSEIFSKIKKFEKISDQKYKTPALR